MNPCHVVLIGMMGSGKSTIGKQLAERLQWDFCDIDVSVETQAQQTITDIFKTKGEAAFRQLESQCLADVLQKEIPMIIATGGGIVTSVNNQTLLKKNCVIYLQAPIDVLVARLAKEASNRPLLGDGQDLKNKLQALLLARKDKYQACSQFQIEQTTTVIAMVSDIVTFLSFNTDTSD